MYQKDNLKFTNFRLTKKNSPAGVAVVVVVVVEVVDVGVVADANWIGLHHFLLGPMQ